MRQLIIIINISERAEFKIVYVNMYDITEKVK